MNIEEIRNYCLSKPACTEGTPFGEDTLVFKVFDKMFALLSMSDKLLINIKCDPEWAIELRGDHPAITAGYHMSKKHWNSVYYNEFFDNELLIKMIDHSYDLVASKLKKSQKEELKKLHSKK